MRALAGNTIVGVVLALFINESRAETELRPVARLAENRFAGSPGYAVAFSPDGKLLANALYRIGIWEVATGKRLVEMEGHWSRAGFVSRGVTGLAFSHDGKTLISAGGDGAIRTWDTPTGKMQQEILVPWWWVDNEERGVGRVPLNGMSLSPDSRRVAVAAHGGSVHLWNLETREQEWSTGTNVSEKLDPRRFGAVDESLKIKEVWKLPLEFNNWRPEPLFSPDGQSLAIAGSGAVEVWDVKSRELMFKTATGGEAVYSPDGRSLVTARYGGVAIWDARTGERTGGFTDDHRIFTPLCFARDGRLITGSEEVNGIRIWEFPAGRLLKSLANGGPGPASIAVSPDGKTLAAATGRSRLDLWNLPTGKLQCDGGHS